MDSDAVGRANIGLCPASNCLYIEILAGMQLHVHCDFDALAEHAPAYVYQRRSIDNCCLTNN